MTPAVPRIVIAGLGPAGPELVAAGVADLATGDRPVYLRTTRHPAASVAPGAVSFDARYEAAATLDEVYTGIVDDLVAAAGEHGEVVYLVPGSPLVAERTVALLLDHPDRAAGSLEVEVVPGLSFLELAWVRLGVDPVAEGVRVVDGHRFASEAAGERGPLLVAQCDSAEVLAEVKLAVGEVVDAGAAPGDVAVTVLRHLGLPDEVVTEVVWHELDRLDADHLTSLWLPAAAAPVAAEVARFAELVATLRRECPWDREQTHDSLKRHLIEEAYEVLDAIDGVDVEAGTGYEHLEEELGDLLFQVLFHAQLAAEAGQFTLADVARTVHDKLHARHPHVFGGVDVDSPDQVAANWEQIKKAEKGRASVFDGIPDALPSLLFALKVLKKGAALAEGTSVGHDGVEGLPPVPSVGAAVAAVEVDPTEETVGGLLLAVVDAARRVGVEPETALRATAGAWRDAAALIESGRSVPKR